MKINIVIESSPMVIARESFYTGDSAGLNGVYIMYDISDVCLYVGKTKDFIKRMRGHARDSDFYRQIEYVEFYHNPNEYKKDIVETYLINEFKPLYNKAKTYYLQGDLEAILDEIEEEEHSLRAQISDIKYSKSSASMEGLFPEWDDYEISAIVYEDKVDALEMAELEQRLSHLHKYKYEIASKMSL